MIINEHVINKLFNNIKWSVDSNYLINNSIRINSWLNEKNSMTRRLESYSDKIIIRCLYNNFIFNINNSFIYTDRVSLGCFWFREVLIYGYNKPWMIARSFVPLGHKKIGLIQDISKLGNDPLGILLYHNRIKPKKEYVKFGSIGKILARQTKFIFDKYNVLFLNEIFLPECPLYVL